MIRPDRITDASIRRAAFGRKNGQYIFGLGSTTIFFQRDRQKPVIAGQLDKSG
jgi:hypothetical protein